ncbi:MAG: Xylose isomerase [Pedosphaera sp.]|jgi:sugar phosphate isomerase/epimerase|nr:Xylose isomerase [Pedosphaera sp.]
MYLTGIADEAGALIDTQIKATRELGWQNIEARMTEVPGFPKGNIHDIPEAAFDMLVDKVAKAGIKINGFGSAIGNWGKKIEQPGDASLEETRRAIPRMQKLGTKMVRIMSFAIRDAEDQMETERFRRLREITKLFLDAGIQPVHENCQNYGGMGWPFSLKLLENVPGLKLVFDTGNPVFTADYTKPKPRPMQDAWEFYSHVKAEVVHVHVKDCVWSPAKNNADYKFPGEGDGQVRKILKDLFMNGYDGGISIEPHMAVVFHDKSVTASPEAQYDNYVEYGRRMEKMIKEIKAELGQKV